MSRKFRSLVRDDSEYFRIFDDSNSDDDERDTDLETLLGKQSPSKLSSKPKRCCVWESDFKSDLLGHRLLTVVVTD